MVRDALELREAEQQEVVYWVQPLGPKTEAKDCLACHSAGFVYDWFYVPEGRGSG